MPAMPWGRPPVKALCVAPLGMEEGSEAEVPNQEFGLVVGEPAEFRFLGSSVRRTDTVGTLVEEWDDEIEELSPLTTTLEAPDRAGQVVPVHLQSKVTEIGTGTVVPQPRQQAEMETGVQRARAGVIVPFAGQGLPATVEGRFSQQFQGFFSEIRAACHLPGGVGPPGL